MKNIYIYIIIGVTILLGLGVLAVIFIKSGDSSEKINNNQINNMIDNEIENDIENDDTNDQGDPDCPEGIVCLGLDSIASVPTLVMGEDEVYAAELDNNDDNNDIEDDDTDDPEPTIIKDNTPIKVTVTNKDFSIWTVTWITKTAQEGYIEYGISTDELSRIAYDDRDINDSPEARFTHHVTIENSQDDLTNNNLTFYYQIVSGEEKFNLGGGPYSYQNAPLTSSPSTPYSVSISTSNVGSSDDYYAVTTVKLNGNVSQPVSNNFNNLGGTELVIGIARKNDLSSYFPIDTSNGTVDITLYGPNGRMGKVEDVKLKDTENNIIIIPVSISDYTGEPPVDNDYETDPKDNNIPKTSLLKDSSFYVIWGSVITVLGFLMYLVYTQENKNILWEKRVIRKIDKE